MYVSSVLKKRNLLDYFLSLHENTLEVKSCFVAPERKFNKTSPYLLAKAVRPGFTGSAADQEKPSEQPLELYMSFYSELVSLMTSSVKAREVKIRLTLNKVLPLLSILFLDGTRGQRHGYLVF